MNFSKNFLRIVFVLFTLNLIACQSSPDFDVLRMEILDLHQATIDAHWQKDVDFLTKDMSKDYLFVQNGEIERP